MLVRLSLVLLASLFTGSMSTHARAQAYPQPYVVPPPVLAYPSELYEQSVSLHIQQLVAREQELVRAGRPENYGLKMGVSIAALCIGASELAFLYPLAFASDSSDVSTVSMALTVTGLAAVAGGVTGIIVLRHRRAYRREIKVLRAERKYWTAELKRVRAQQSWLPEPAAVALLFGPQQIALRARF